MFGAVVMLLATIDWDLFITFFFLHQMKLLQQTLFVFRLSWRIDPGTVGKVNRVNDCVFILNQSMVWY